VWEPLQKSERRSLSLLAAVFLPEFQFSDSRFNGSDIPFENLSQLPHGFLFTEQQF